MQAADTGGGSRRRRSSLAVSQIQPHSQAATIRLAFAQHRGLSSRFVPSVFPAASERALRCGQTTGFEPACEPAALRYTARTQSRPTSWQTAGTSRTRTSAGSALRTWSKPCAARNKERDACLTSKRRVGRRHRRLVAVPIACLDPIAVCARWPPSFSAVRGPNVSSVWCHDDDGDRDRIVNSKTRASSTRTLEKRQC